jgi:hypothetical protein
MESKRVSESNEITNLELALEEFTKEQKSQTKTIQDLVISVETLSGRYTDFEKELLKPIAVSNSTNTQPIQEIVKKGISDIKMIVSNQPKSVVKKFQILMFPEQDAKLFYKIVFGRWFLWLIIMLVLTDFYKVIIHWSDNQKEIKLHLLQNDRIKKSWNFLYFHHSKGFKKLMDSTYNANTIEGN